jgi:hypothetical protein
VDAFTRNWSFFFHAFPPFSIISKILNKIITDKAQGILVVPDWRTQPWYPVFTKLLISKPLYFYPKPNLFVSPFRESHPLWNTITLVVGLLSGNTTLENTSPMQELKY